MTENSRLLFWKFKGLKYFSLQTDDEKQTSECAKWHTVSFQLKSTQPVWLMCDKISRVKVLFLTLSPTAHKAIFQLRLTHLVQFPRWDLSNFPIQTNQTPQFRVIKLPSLVWTTLYNFEFRLFHFEGPQPEWCISSMIYSRDIPFWSETLHFIPLPKPDWVNCVNSSVHTDPPYPTSLALGEWKHCQSVYKCASKEKAERGQEQQISSEKRQSR